MNEDGTYGPEAEAYFLSIMYPRFDWDDLMDTTATDDRKGS